VNMTAALSAPVSGSAYSIQLQTRSTPVSEPQRQNRKCGALGRS